MRFPIQVFYYKGSYSAVAPDVPGCVAAAGSIEAVRDLMAEALTAHLEIMRASGERVPKPTKRLDVTLTDLEEGEYYTWVEIPRVGPIRRRQPKRKAAGKS